MRTQAGDGTEVRSDEGRPGTALASVLPIQWSSGEGRQARPRVSKLIVNFFGFHEVFQCVLNDSGIVHVQDLIAQAQIRAGDLTRYVIERIDRLEPRLIHYRAQSIPAQ